MKKPDPSVTWRAGADQIAHGHRRGKGITRTLCFARIVDPRHEWPAVVRCPDCLREAGVEGVPIGQ